MHFWIPKMHFWYPQMHCWNPRMHFWYPKMHCWVPKMHFWFPKMNFGYKKCIFGTSKCIFGYQKCIFGYQKCIFSTRIGNFLRGPPLRNFPSQAKGQTQVIQWDRDVVWSIFIMWDQFLTSTCHRKIGSKLFFTMFLIQLDLFNPFESNRRIG